MNLHKILKYVALALGVIGTVFAYNANNDRF